MEQLMNSYMAILAERNAAIRERNMAIIEKKKALVDRDMALLERDGAVADRNRAIMERDDAIAQVQSMDNSTEIDNLAHIPPENGFLQGARQMHQRQHMHHFAEAAFSPREVPFSDAFLNSNVSEPVKSKKAKQAKEAKTVSAKVSSGSKKGKRGTKVSSKQVTIAALSGFKNGPDLGGEGEDMNRPIEWKEDLCLNQICFDDATIPVPVCSCTGVLQPCYKWGNGGWQSACCTNTMSMYPLPQLPNKRHSRIGGRKMSGSAFSKLLSRLATEGIDMSTPLDLKHHWAKHGTNRYSTIK